MNVGLYFGSFNPVHTGHLIIASHLLNSQPLDRIWMVVSPRNPFKQAHSLLNEYDRLHLLQLAVADDPRIKASDVEFSLPKPSFTSVTLAHLAEKYPEHRFSLVMGADSFQNLPKWNNAAYIIGSYPIYVYPRPGFTINDHHGADMTLVQAPLLELSATRIRDNVSAGKSIRYMVPDVVREEIEKSNYYK